MTVATIKYGDPQITINLTSEAIWENEFAGYSPVSQSAVKAMNGAVIHEYLYPISYQGRPIELSAEWIPRETLTKLETLRDREDQTHFTLTLVDGRQFLVYFDHTEGPIDSEPAVRRADSLTPGIKNDYNNIVLRFLVLDQL